MNMFIRLFFVCFAFSSLFCMWVFFLKKSSLCLFHICMLYVHERPNTTLCFYNVQTSPSFSHTHGFISFMKLFDFFTFQMLSPSLVPHPRVFHSMPLPFATEKVLQDLPTRASPTPASPFPGASSCYRIKHILSPLLQSVRSHGPAHICSLVGG